MEFKERIENHRSKLEQNVDVEKLYPLLQQDKAITKEEIAQIETLPTKQAKVGKLLDVLLSKDSSALQSFYLVLQKMYQHILTAMFIQPQFSSARSTQQESCSTSLTSDSEDDGSRVQLATNPRPMEFGARTKMTKIIPSHQYDPNSTMSSSFPTFSEHRSPACVSVERQSPVLTGPCEPLTKHGGPDKPYDWFFKEFEWAFNELKVLKQQNAGMMDMRDRYDQISKEAEHLRVMHKNKSQCLQQVTSELLSLKGQQSELHTEKKQLLEEIANLQKLRSEDKQELVELRHQQRKTASESGTSDGLLDKYENMHKDYDLLREQYAEMITSRGAALAR
ncbi:uncharacterized protein LOC101847086 [Aplysia californica]|uniref:Uncharacterized protein LOC101847086 n=1 Tax=Aplysia californica TaxID=6500 RepID=A0ABM0KBA2_APLCA|nr:uncharacterized protein LOC101847086 [Aplysia californica]